MPTLPKKSKTRPWVTPRKPFDGMKNKGVDRKFYDTARWKRLRKMILNRDGGLCQECKRNGKITVGVHVDHIVPIRKGGSLDDMENLVLLCRSCHAKKTMHDGRGEGTNNP